MLREALDMVQLSFYRMGIERGQCAFVGEVLGRAHDGDLRVIGLARGHVTLCAPMFQRSTSTHRPASALRPTRTMPGAVSIPFKPSPRRAASPRIAVSAAAVPGPGSATATATPHVCRTSQK